MSDGTKRTVTSKELVCKFCEMPIAPGEERESAMGGYGHDRESLCIRALTQEIERLRGIKPELPPRPPDDGDQALPRYGIRWNDKGAPLSVPMVDGYWTPWHLADRHALETNDRIADRLRQRMLEVGDSPDDYGDLLSELDRGAHEATLASPGDLSPEKFQEAWRKANRSPDQATPEKIRVYEETCEFHPFGCPLYCSI